MELLDGKKISEKLAEDLKEKISSFNETPRLDIFMIGDNPSSEKYVLMKEKKAEEIGIKTVLHRYTENSSEDEITGEIKTLNHDDSVNGIMIQLPIPAAFNVSRILNSISIEKDVDGLTAESLGRLFRNEDTFVSATAEGIEILLKSYGINLEGKKVAVLGRSREVGLPVSALMLKNNATVTICHSHTIDLKDICKQADVLISCMGQSKFVNKEFVKDGAVVMDVGFNVDTETGKSTGDVDFDDVKDIVSYITPVPGGVGPMTIVSLLKNVVDAYEKRIS